MFYSMKDWKLITFEKSKTKNKKYDMIIQNLVNNKIVRIPFGAASYQQFKDSTGLGLYTHKDHRDLKRRQLYRQRHAKDIRPGYFSPGWASWTFLW